MTNELSDVSEGSGGNATECRSLPCSNLFFDVVSEGSGCDSRTARFARLHKILRVSNNHPNFVDADKVTDKVKRGLYMRKRATGGLSTGDNPYSS